MLINTNQSYIHYLNPPPLLLLFFPLPSLSLSHSINRHDVKRFEKPNERRAWETVLATKYAEESGVVLGVVNPPADPKMADDFL